jgi:hypothetical protein
MEFFLKWARNQWDRVGAWVAIGLGLLLLLLGWQGVSRVPFVEEQLSYLASGGLGGLFLLGVGSTLWLSADLRDEWRQLDRLEERCAALERQLATGDASAGRS